MFVSDYLTTVMTATFLNTALYSSSNTQVAYNYFHLTAVFFYMILG